MPTYSKQAGKIVSQYLIVFRNNCEDIHPRSQLPPVDIFKLAEGLTKRDLNKGGYMTEYMKITVSKEIHDKLIAVGKPGQALAGIIQDLLEQPNDPIVDPSLKTLQDDYQTNVQAHNENVKKFAEEVTVTKAALQAERAKISQEVSTLNIQRTELAKQADILKVNETQTKATADEIIRKAKAEAESLVDMAKAEVITIQETKETQALKAMQETSKALDIELTQKTERLHILNKKFTKRYNQMLEDGEREMNYHKHKMMVNSWGRFLDSLENWFKI